VTAWRIRPAGMGDVRALARIYVASWRVAYRGLIDRDYLDSMSVDLEARGFRETVARMGGGGHACFVADQPGVPPAGFVTLGPARAVAEMGEIYTLYLLPARQGRGLGRRLLGEAAEHLRAEGFGSAVVWVLRDNPARGFYAAMGGRAGDVRRFRVGRQGLPAVAYDWPDLRALEERCAGLSTIALPPPLLSSGGAAS